MSFYGHPLTANQDIIDGKSGSDLFSGPAGGDDDLRGYGGDDLFEFDASLGQQTGRIDGGDGTDTLHLIRDTETINENLQINSVEKLVVDADTFYVTVDRLQDFRSISGNKDFLFLTLQGEGGSLDLSHSNDGPAQINLYASTTSAVHIIGSAHTDQINGSRYNDWLNGYKGDDAINGGQGADKLNGGIGKDYLSGSTGPDSFYFDTMLGSSNVDHLTDFHAGGDDDTIRLNHHVFRWADEHGGELKASAFKVIGNGGHEDADDHILYDRDTGALYYDVDGRGGHLMVKFAVLDTHPHLTSSDILVV